jgi:hypothetical protein
VIKQHLKDFAVFLKEINENYLKKSEKADADSGSSD